VLKYVCHLSTFKLRGTSTGVSQSQLPSPAHVYVQGSPPQPLGGFTCAARNAFMYICGAYEACNGYSPLLVPAHNASCTCAAHDACNRYSSLLVIPTICTSGLHTSPLTSPHNLEVNYGPACRLDCPNATLQSVNQTDASAFCLGVS
jgi:hypothetical protein